MILIWCYYLVSFTPLKNLNVVLPLKMCFSGKITIDYSSGGNLKKWFFSTFASIFLLFSPKTLKYTTQLLWSYRKYQTTLNYIFPLSTQLDVGWKNLPEFFFYPTSMWHDLHTLIWHHHDCCCRYLIGIWRGPIQ